MTVYQNDVVRVTAKMRMFNADAVQNVYHIKNVTAADVTNDDFREHVSKWLDALYSCIITMLSNNLGFVEIELFNVTRDEPIDPVEFDIIEAGEDTTNTLPFGTCLLASMKTAAARTSGRKYFGVFCEDGINDTGQWHSTLLTLAICMLQYLFGLQTFFSVNSRPGTYNYTTSTFNEFVSASIDAIPAYQRRRREGEGA